MFKVHNSEFENRSLLHLRSFRLRRPHLSSRSPQAQFEKPRADTGEMAVICNPNWQHATWAFYRYIPLVAAAIIFCFLFV